MSWTFMCLSYKDDPLIQVLIGLADPYSNAHTRRFEFLDHAGRDDGLIGFPSI